MQPTLYDNINAQQILTGFDPLNQAIARDQAQRAATEELGRRMFMQQADNQQRAALEAERLRRQYELMFQNSKSLRNEERANLEKDRASRLAGNTKSAVAIRDSLAALEAERDRTAAALDSKINQTARAMAIYEAVSTDPVIMAALKQTRDENKLKLLLPPEKRAELEALIQAGMPAAVTKAATIAPQSELLKLRDLDKKIQVHRGLFDDTLKYLHADGGDISSLLQTPPELIGPPPPPNDGAPVLPPGGDKKQQSLGGGALQEVFQRGLDFASKIVDPLDKASKVAPTGRPLDASSISLLSKPDEANSARWEDAANAARFAILQPQAGPAIGMGNRRAMDDAQFQGSDSMFMQLPTGEVVERLPESTFDNLYGKYPGSTPAVNGGFNKFGPNPQLTQAIQAAQRKAAQEELVRKARGILGQQAFER